MQHAANKRKRCARAERCEELQPTVRLFVANFDILNMASSDSDFSDVEANAEVDVGDGIVNEGLPRGYERDLIEYYFNRGLTYRQITHLDMNERT